MKEAKPQPHWPSESELERVTTGPKVVHSHIQVADFGNSIHFDRTDHTCNVKLILTQQIPGNYH